LLGKKLPSSTQLLNVSEEKTNKPASIFTVQIFFSSGLSAQTKNDFSDKMVTSKIKKKQDLDVGRSYLSRTFAGDLESIFNFFTVFHWGDPAIEQRDHTMDHVCPVQGICKAI